MARVLLRAGGMNTQQIHIGPVRIDKVTSAEALTAIEQLVRARRGGFVVTPNVDHIICAREDAWFREVYKDASLSLADGKPLLWMAQLQGEPLPEKVSGSDLMLPLMERAAAEGWRVYLVGATPEVSAAGERRLREQFPSLQIVGRDTSHWSTQKRRTPAAMEVVRQIREARADLVVVALGSPKQELWMDTFADEIRPSVAIGLGASLDFVAGASRRAPRWMSEAGLEWAFRLAREPRRLAHRYLVRGPRIVPIFAAAWVRRRLGSSPAPSQNGSEAVPAIPKRGTREGRNPHLSNVLIVGRGPLARQTAADLSRRRGIHVLGTLAIAGETPSPGMELENLGDCSALGDILSGTTVAEVYLAADIGTHREVLQRAIETCEELGIPFAVPAHAFRLGRAMPSRRAAAPDGYIHYRLVTPHPLQRAIKRCLDFALSAVAILALLPLFAALAAAIKLTSKGPVLFSQTRVGLRGRHFSMYKFRSMVVDAERLIDTLREKNEQTGPVFKIRKDPRVTRVGRFLRAFSLDELPQLINVLKGEMSLVGPRPPIPSEVAQYAPWQRRRLSVRPGLTCLWQVSGRNEIGFEQWMMLDLQYIDQWSLMSDLRLIGKTIPVVLGRQGAS